MDNCVNFNQIGELFPELEIINSKFTARAGTWSLLFYAKDQQVTKVEDIRSLDLSGKGLLFMTDISIFEKCLSLTTLNISDHPEFLMTEEQFQEEEAKMKEGSPDQQEIEFGKRLHHIDQLLFTFNAVKNLTCDDDLEEYILKNRPEKGFLPALRTINDVSVSITDEAERVKERNIRKVMRELWKYAGTYRIVTEEQMDEENVWYINDEVGSLIKHSDQPNIAIHPFIYAPNNKFDAHTITYSICWPLKDMS